MAHADYITRMETFVRTEDDDQIDDTEKSACLDSAVDEHSRHRPLLQFHDVTGSGVFDYDLPADWQEGFSQILSIEYPVDATSQSRSMLDRDEWELWYDVDNTKWQLRFLTAEPATGETARVEYTTIHSVSTTPTDTVLESHFTAVCLLGAAYCYESLAARYTQTMDPTLAVDTVDYQSKGQQYTSLANKLRGRYFVTIGGNAENKGPKPAFVVGDMDTEFANRTDHLTHSRRYR